MIKEKNAEKLKILQKAQADFDELMKNLANVYALGLLEEALRLAEAEKGFLPPIMEEWA